MNIENIIRDELDKVLGEAKDGIYKEKSIMELKSMSVQNKAKIVKIIMDLRELFDQHDYFENDSKYNDFLDFVDAKFKELKSALMQEKGYSIFETKLEEMEKILKISRRPTDYNKLKKKFEQGLIGIEDFLNI